MWTVKLQAGLAGDDEVQRHNMMNNIELKSA